MGSVISLFILYTEKKWKNLSAKQVFLFFTDSPDIREKVIIAICGKSMSQSVSRRLKHGIYNCHFAVRSCSTSRRIDISLWAASAEYGCNNSGY